MYQLFGLNFVITFFCNCLSTEFIKYIKYLKIILVFIIKIYLAKFLKKKLFIIN